MKRDTRREILETAKKLFNEHGYNSVSTRDISNAVGISKGNLTYHFKKKEDIVEALVEEMHSGHKKPEVPSTLAELNLMFLQKQSHVEENAFYFRHKTQLAQTSKKIRDIQNQVILNQYYTFQKAFETLNRDGILRNEEYPGQHEQIIRVISLTCIYWMPHDKLEQWGEHKSGFLDCVWSVIYPLLTEKGKIEYLRQIQAV